MKLKPYRWWPSHSADWSILVFATNRKEARIVGHRARPDGQMGDYLYCHVNALPMWREYLDQATSDEPHAIDSPESCDECGWWPVSQCECVQADE